MYGLKNFKHAIVKSLFVYILNNILKITTKIQKNCFTNTKIQNCSANIKFLHLSAEKI